MSSMKKYSQSLKMFNHSLSTGVLTKTLTEASVSVNLKKEPNRMQFLSIYFAFKC